MDRVWKVTAFRGALAVAFAAVILIWPGIGLAALTALFGAFALVSGIASITGALRAPIPRGRRASLALEGLVGIAVGIAVLVWPDLSAVALLYAIAAWAIANGILELGLALVRPPGGGRTLLLVIDALLSVAFGAIMFAHPGAGAVALLTLVAAFALMTGVMQIARALELRSVIVAVERPLRPRPTARTAAQG
jgi:uncharacterized membrane protein HdeD (DUF308 family)